MPDSHKSLSCTVLSLIRCRLSFLLIPGFAFFSLILSGCTDRSLPNHEPRPIEIASEYEPKTASPEPEPSHKLDDEKVIQLPREEQKAPQKTALAEPVRTKKPVEKKSPRPRKSVPPITPSPTKKEAPPFGEGPVAESIEAITPSHQMAQKYVRDGNIMARDGNYQEAIDLYRRAVEINPREWSAFLGLGISYAGIGRNEESAQSYETFLMLAPQDHPMRKNVQKLVNIYRENL